MPPACDWPAFPETHAGPVDPVVVTDVLELGVKLGQVELKNLCAAHRERLAVEVDVSEPDEVARPEVGRRRAPPCQVADRLAGLRATIREELDKLGVSLTDEWSVYHGLVWTGLLTELARNGLEHTAISFETYEAIAEITTTIGAALMEYAPEGVRPR